MQKTMPHFSSDSHRHFPEKKKERKRERKKEIKKEKEVTNIYRKRERKD
jgi:hypothetical protein